MSSSSFDTRTTTYSPDGRLYQVEYAIQAIENAGACVGLLGVDCAVIGAERKIQSPLLVRPSKSEKIYMLDDHVACAVAGLTADATVLINYLRRMAAKHRLEYQEPMPLEPLIQHVCDLKQGYTQYGGMRPFGVSFIYAGFDDHYGFQLYQSDPSGNYNGWKATAIGANHIAAESLLKSSYQEGMSLNEVLKLAVRVLTKSMDTTTPSPEKMEFTVLRRNPKTGKLTQRVLPDDEVAQLLAETKEADAEEGDT